MAKSQMSLNTSKFGVVIAALLLTASLSACQPERAVPTVASIESLATETFQTQEAPPANFQQAQFEKIDTSLNVQPAWHAIVTLSFEGTYAETNDPTSGSIVANIYTNELSAEKRVLLEVKGEPFSASEDGSTIEGVRIGNDYYLVNQNKVCTVAADPANRRITELTPSSLIGGVRQAQFTYTRREINERRTWEYAFTPGNVIPPPLEIKPNGGLTIASGTLWVAAEIGLVAEYQITFNVTNVVIQGSKPLTGTLRVKYELQEVGTLFNISIPFGC
jgi:hypothetical protein